MGNKATVCNKTTKRIGILVFNYNDWIYTVPSEKRVVDPGQSIDVYGIAGGGAVKIAVLRHKKASDMTNVQGNVLENVNAIVCDLFCINDGGKLTIKSVSNEGLLTYDTVDSKERREEGKLLYLSQTDVGYQLDIKSPFGTAKNALVGVEAAISTVSNIKNLGGK